MKASQEQTFVWHKLVISVMNKATELEILLLLLHSGLPGKQVSCQEQKCFPQLGTKLFTNSAKKNCLINQQDQCPNNIVLGESVKKKKFVFVLRAFLPLPPSLSHRSLAFTFYQVTEPLPNPLSQSEGLGDRVGAGFDRRGGGGSWLGMGFLLFWVWVGSTNLQTLEY